MVGFDNAPNIPERIRGAFSKWYAACNTLDHRKAILHPCHTLAPCTISGQNLCDRSAFLRAYEKALLVFLLAGAATTFSRGAVHIPQHEANLGNFVVTAAHAV